VRRLVAVLVAVAVAAAAWIAVAALDDDDEPAAPERPRHLVDVPLSSVTRIDVIAPSSGRSEHLTVDGNHLADASGTVTSNQLGALQDALFPLLAIRLFDEQQPEFGLEPPRVVARIVSGDRTFTIRIGNANFDRTGVYADVDGQLALVLTVVDSVLSTLVDARSSR
jgi:hypothetical protein